MSDGVLKSWAEEAGEHMEEYAVRLTECSAEDVAQISFFGSSAQDEAA